MSIVDTPGFDDTVRSDTEVLREITSFLSVQHQLGIRLKGIIYLHSIVENRMRGSSVRYLDMFQRICGEQAFPNIILATTMWDMLRNQSDGYQRDQQLREEFWNGLEEKGSMIAQFDGSPAMAAGLLVRLLAKDDVVLRVQEELNVLEYSLENTAVGRLVTPRLEDEVRKSFVELSEIDDGMLKAESAGRFEDRREYEQRQKDVLKRLEEKLKQRQELKTKVGSEAAEKIREEKKKSAWKDRVPFLATIAGITISLFANLLPALGVY